MDMFSGCLVPESASQIIQTADSSSDGECDAAGAATMGSSPLLGRRTPHTPPASPLLTKRKRVLSPSVGISRALKPRRILDLLQPDEEELALQSISSAEPSGLSRLLECVLGSGGAEGSASAQLAAGPGEEPESCPSSQRIEIDEDEAASEATPAPTWGTWSGRPVRCVPASVLQFPAGLA
jgi:hypothetical protein